MLLTRGVAAAQDKPLQTAQAAARVGERLISVQEVRDSLSAQGVDPDRAPGALWASELNTLVDRAIIAAAARGEGMKGTEEELVRRYLSEKFGAKLFVSNEEVRRWYEGHQAELRRPERRLARMITIGRPVAAKDAMAKLMGIRKLAAEGGDFAALAKEHSMDPCAGDGGALPPVEKPAIQGTLSAEVFKLGKEGEISPVFETPLGYHIVKLEKIVPERTLTPAEAEPMIRQALQKEKWEQFVEPRLRQLRRSTCVQIYLGQSKPA